MVSNVAFNELIFNDLTNEELLIIDGGLDLGAVGVGLIFMSTAVMAICYFPVLPVALAAYGLATIGAAVMHEGIYGSYW